MRALTLFTFLITLASALPCWPQEPFTLEKYLSQVETNNQDIRSVNFSIMSIDQKIQEVDTAYVPFLGAGLSYTKDKSGPGLNSTLPTKEMDIVGLNVGINKKWRTGTSLSFTYTDMLASLDLLTPTQVIGPDKVTSLAGFQIKPSVRIDQSLIKDTKNGLTQAGIGKAKASALSGRYLLLFRKQQILQQARAAYWALSLSREVVEFRALSLERAQQVLVWNENKVKLDLAEKSDLYQAQAAYKLRQLLLQQAVEDEEKARRRFNEFRGATSSTVDESVEKIADVVDNNAGVATLVKAGERADVLSAVASLESMQFARKEAFLRTGHDVSVFGSAAFSGLDTSYAGTWEQVLSIDKPIIAVGVMYTTPLNFSISRTVRKGYENDLNAARENLAKAQLSSQNAWDELVRAWNEVKVRLALAREIRDIQSLRLEEEQRKSQRGRTTTFLRLNAENDLDDATLNVYRLAFEELMVLAQVELYSTKPF